MPKQTNTNANVKDENLNILISDLKIFARDENSTEKQYRHRYITKNGIQYG